MSQEDISSPIEKKSIFINQNKMTEYKENQLIFVNAWSIIYNILKDVCMYVLFGCFTGFGL